MLGKLSWGLVPFLLPWQCAALLLEPLVTFSSGNGSALEITGADVIYSKEDPVGVRIASESLVKDLEQITGEERRLLTWDELESDSSSSSAIIVGTIDSDLIKSLVDEGVIETEWLEGKWESFITAVVDSPMSHVGRALLIIGSDKRGAIFGVHTLAEQSGQSPYHYWADVPTKKHDHIYALSKTTRHGEPSIKYRGLFINDEAPSLNNWWGRFDGDEYRKLDAEFYEHVFDLLLRLKANMLWPAMWASFTPRPGNAFFTDDPKNQQLAHDYGIVVSTSHHEPMQRASNEWNTSETGSWSWKENSENITKFMDAGAERAGTNESIFTLGMRGLSDKALEGTDEAIEILTEVFEAQRNIIEKYHDSADAVPQVWALYKEVISYYEAGLDPPQDVTLLFPDDNFGNVRRLPVGEEVDRPGGCGVYFHLEYVGDPRAYKWANTNNLPKVFKDMYHSYARGATRIWMVNVGDIKPMETPFGFIMDVAWNIDNFDFETIPDYVEAYAAREFGDELASDVAEMLWEFSHLVGLRKYESTHSGTFSTLNYHESERILARWEKLADRATATYNNDVSEEYKPAFYQLVYYPIISGKTYISIQIGIGTNYRYAWERRNAANAIADQVRDEFDYSFDLVGDWDEQLEGKWKHMMDQAVYDVNPQPPKVWAAPARDVLANLSYVQLRQNMPYAVGNMGIRAEGSDGPIQQARVADSIESTLPAGLDDSSSRVLLPVSDRYTVPSRHFDLFARGDHRVPINWQLDDSPVDWLKIEPTSGTLDQDNMVQRLNVTIDWDSVPDDFDENVNVGIHAEPAVYTYFDILRIPVLNVKAPDDFKGFPASAYIISIEAPHFQRSNSGGGDTAIEFEKIPGLATRSESGSIALRPFGAARSDKEGAEAASVEYDIYLFKAAQRVRATIYINMCHETDPDAPFRYSLTVDDAPVNMTRLVGQSNTDPHSGDLPPQWMQRVADMVWTRTVNLGSLDAGAHTIRWAADSPEVYLEKIVLDMGDYVKPSYLGPPETPLLD